MRVDIPQSLKVNTFKIIDDRPECVCAHCRAACTVYHVDGKTLVMHAGTACQGFQANFAPGTGGSAIGADANETFLGSGDRPVKPTDPRRRLGEGEKP